MKKREIARGSEKERKREREKETKIERERYLREKQAWVEEKRMGGEGV